MFKYGATYQAQEDVCCGIQWFACCRSHCGVEDPRKFANDYLHNADIVEYWYNSADEDAYWKNLQRHGECCQND